MKPVVFEGAGVAIVTPMKPDGSVDFDKLAELIEFQIENSTDAIISCGTTGEKSTISKKEHADILKFTVERVNHRVPVVAGTGGNETYFSAELSEAAESFGADAVLLVTPYYNKTSQAGLVAHFNYIADHVNIPCILYNVPSRTGVNIEPETYLKLCKHRNIVATKEASGNLSKIAQTAALCGDELTIYSGNDDQIVPIMSLGGKGVISVLSNVAPKAAHDICRAMLDGDMKTGVALQLEWLDLINDLFIDVNPIPVKEALNMMGWNVGECRLPLINLSESAHEKLRLSMKKHGLI